jgi:PAT family beta-lactamase induction signal transducer AmpG
MAVALQTPFFVDLGFSGTQIGTIAKLTGFIASLVGGLVGGVIMIKLGINRALWVFGLVQMLTILGFAALAEVGNDPYMLGVAMSLEYLGVGLGTAALTAFIARSSDPAFAATQLSLFTALAAVPRVTSNAVTGLLVERFGWTNFFVLCMFLAIPGMLLLFKVAPWKADVDEEPEPGEGGA